LYSNEFDELGRREARPARGGFALLARQPLLLRRFACSDVPGPL
jgi:hypothetical protein